jgi:hypothetical protein
LLSALVVVLVVLVVTFIRIHFFVRLVHRFFVFLFRLQSRPSERFSARQQDQQRLVQVRMQESLAQVDTKSDRQKGDHFELFVFSHDRTSLSYFRFVAPFAPVQLPLITSTHYDHVIWERFILICRDWRHF